MKSSRTAGPREPARWSVCKRFRQIARRARTVGVFHGDDLLVVIQVVQERGEDPPAGIQLIVTDEVGVVALQSIQDQRLVGFGDLEVGEAAAVGEVELSHNRLHGQARQLGVHLDVHGLVGLDADNELVARDVLENSGGNVTELDTDLGLLLVQGCEILVYQSVL